MRRCVLQCSHTHASVPHDREVLQIESSDKISPTIILGRELGRGVGEISTKRYTGARRGVVTYRKSQSDDYFQLRTVSITPISVFGPFSRAMPWKARRTVPERDKRLHHGDIKKRKKLVKLNVFN